MSIIQFQQAAADSGSSQPWPVIIRGGDIIYGRPDASGIVGFSPKPHPDADGLVVASEVLDPSSIIGWYPTFVEDGKFFMDTRPITSAAPLQLTGNAEASLHERELELRAALERTGVVSSTWTVIADDTSSFGFQVLAAIRGRHEVDLNGSAVVTYVQSLNAADAKRQADEELNAPLDDYEED